MILFCQLAAAIFLLIFTLCFQCAGRTTIIEWLRHVLMRDRNKHGPSYSAILVMKSMAAIIILHGIAILLWAGFCRTRCFPSWELAFCFPASSNSTMGFGDLVLPSNWRLLGPLESITGVLMCGISVSVLFALVSHLVDRDTESLANPKEQSHA